MVIVSKDKSHTSKIYMFKGHLIDKVEEALIIQSGVLHCICSTGSSFFLYKIPKTAINASLFRGLKWKKTLKSAETLKNLICLKKINKLTKSVTNLGWWCTWVLEAQTNGRHGDGLWRSWRCGLPWADCASAVSVFPRHSRTSNIVSLYMDKILQHMKTNIIVII